MVTLASAIEFVEQLPTDQQDQLIQIIRNRQIEHRRDEIAQNGREALMAYRAGELKSYTAEEAIAAVIALILFALSLKIQDVTFCQSCGAKLLLRERYRAVRQIGQGVFCKTFLAVDELEKVNDLSLVETALDAVLNYGEEGVESSELNELWQETEEYEAWLASIADLKNRINK